MSFPALIAAAQEIEIKGSFLGPPVRDSIFSRPPRNRATTNRLGSQSRIFDDRQGQVYRAPSQAGPGNDINAGSPGFQKAPTRGPASLVARCFLRAEHPIERYSGSQHAHADDDEGVLAAVPLIICSQTGAAPRSAGVIHKQSALRRSGG
jgi:hypothetical protein